MKSLIYTPIIALMLLLTASCHDITDYADDPRGNFEALWSTLDEHYCFFAQKGVDWDAIHQLYAQRISDVMTSEELFEVCSDMLDELRDGHCNLVSTFNTSYYRRWWSDYPQNYDQRLVEQYYFNFNYRQTGGIKYGILADNIGYIRYPSFSYTIGNGNLDAVLYYLKDCTGLIIDLRDNGGGSMDNVETLFARFITERTLAGYIQHKNGPAHDDFSEPYAYYIDPAETGRIMWGKPTAVLVNRSTFSAANNFVSVIRQLPNVKIVGATTGGGSGMPFSSELPNGWTVRFSSAPILDWQGNSTEFGIDPTEGYAVDLDPVKALDGIDTMLQTAIQSISQ